VPSQNKSFNRSTLRERNTNTVPVNGSLRSTNETNAARLRSIELPEEMAQWSLTSLQLKLIKIGARVIRHARAITFQLAEVAVTGPMVHTILAAIHRLRAPPLCA
jgi:hypothetical protein